MFRPANKLFNCRAKNLEQMSSLRAVGCRHSLTRLTNVNSRWRNERRPLGIVGKEQPRWKLDRRGTASAYSPIIRDLCEVGNQDWPVIGVRRDGIATRRLAPEFGDRHLHSGRCDQDGIDLAILPFGDGIRGGVGRWPIFPELKFTLENDLFQPGSTETC